MSTRVNQLRVSIPPELQKLLNIKASKLGLTMSTYVKNLIINDVKDMAYPTDQVTPATETALQKAKSEERNGTLFETGDIKEYLKKL